MKWNTMNLPTRLYLIGAIILLFGLTSATWIYVTNEDAPANILGYEIVGGKAYLVTPENSKGYVHDLKLMGGNTAVLADEFSRWFISLWHGTALSFTVACITIFLSLGFFFFAVTSPPESESDNQDENNLIEVK